MKIKRVKFAKDRTLGIATLPDGRQFETMELPWNENKVGKSCIPAGHYKFKVDTEGRFQWFKVLKVPKRTHIEFHLGTKPSHSKGCILAHVESLRMMQEFYKDVNLTYVLEIE
jgi:hypothetical protein